MTKPHISTVLNNSQTNHLNYFDKSTFENKLSAIGII